MSDANSTAVDVEKRVQNMFALRKPNPLSTLNPEGCTILAEYFDEIAEAVLEQAVLLAKHKDSKIVDLHDVYLALGIHSVPFCD